MAKNIHHQMGKVLRTLMFEGKIDARMICDLTYSTTPSRRIADLREVFKGSLERSINRHGYAEFRLADDAQTRLRHKYWQLCEDYDSDADVRVALWKWARSQVW